MEDEQANDGQERLDGPATEPEAKPTDTLEFWKAQARKNETAMKANRKELDALRAQLQGSKSVEERLAALEGENAALKAERARAATVREVARATGVSESVVASLNGADAEALAAQARALAEAFRPPSAPRADEAGRKPEGGQTTRADILAIKDRRERRAAIAEHLELFN